MKFNQSDLLIVSDSPMWGEKDGLCYVFEPTLREVEELAKLFRKIKWIGYCHGPEPKTFARTPACSNIEIILLPDAVGGKSLFQKLKLIPFLPKLILVIFKHIRKSKYIHTRGPSVPALIAILISYFDRSRTYWHKYAGNWRQAPAPFAFAIQRFLLRRNPHVITVNGLWPGEPMNVINFENPCLSELELADANKMIPNKPTVESINICFVGALVAAKGIHQFVESLFLISNTKKIGKVYIVGDGSERESLEKKVLELGLQIEFTGNIKRDKINDVYFNSHIIVLPSQSEGFPKVIAEAAAFGCVPIVSNVSSIGQYVMDSKNGILLLECSAKTIAKAINAFLNDPVKLLLMQSEIIKISPLFTFARYLERVQNEVFNSAKDSQ